MSKKGAETDKLVKEGFGTMNGSCPALPDPVYGISFLQNNSHLFTKDWKDKDTPIESSKVRSM